MILVEILGYFVLTVLIHELGHYFFFSLFNCFSKKKQILKFSINYRGIFTEFDCYNPFAIIVISMGGIIFNLITIFLLKNIKVPNEFILIIYNIVMILSSFSSQSFDLEYALLGFRELYKKYKKN